MFEFAVNILGVAFIGFACVALVCGGAIIVKETKDILEEKDND